MHAEIIAIGDELTSGQRLDTNSQWLSQRLGEIGIRVLFHSTVGDELEACRQVFRSAMDRAPMVVATGGLGPTADDLTRHALAEAADCELVLHEESLAHIRGLFTKRNRKMPERNRIQAMIPQGSLVIPNPHGTAPGIDLTVNGQNGPSRVFALPGVPAEMREMWLQSVLHSIQQMPGVSKKVILHHRLKCFGVGESECESMMPDVIRRGRIPSVGITVHKGTITLRVTAEHETESMCREMMKPTIQTIHDSLGSLIFGEDDDEIQDAVVKLLMDRNQSVSVCEWGTAGLIQDWLGLHRASQNVFRGGLTGTSSESITTSLGIAHESRRDNYQDLAEAMASTIRQRFNADYGLAISGFPNEETHEYHIALATPRTIVSRSRPYSSHPDIRRDLAAKTALNLLRIHLLK